METAEKISEEKPDTGTQEGLLTTPVSPDNGDLTWVEPDLVFIRALNKRGGDTFRTCMQCGTCSATCILSPDTRPFPRKEMAWAVWGMKDRLINDPDIWLCYHCSDCTARCPRGARPGEVLSAVREQCIHHFAFPRFLARWVGEPQSVVLLLGVPAALVTLALILRDPIAQALNISRDVGPRIVYSYSAFFPHWLLNSLFLIITGLVILAAIIGVRRFWRALGAAAAKEGTYTPVKSLGQSIGITLKRIFTHEKFAQCTATRLRVYSHVGVFFGFIALTAVTLWVITAGINPLIRGSFIYPFGFWNPWKMLANLGGVAVIAGLSLMMWERWRNHLQTGPGTYFDWTLISAIFLVVVTGFFTEVLHYLRLEPHRHLVYFVHLVFVGALILYLPYSKLAHMLYRTVAMVFAERTGRDSRVLSTSAGGTLEKKEEMIHVG